MSPLISIIIPTLNRPDLLMQAIESALRQSLQQIEVIVVVDGPDNATREALSSIEDSRLKVLQHPESRGCVQGRMTGIEAAAGQWIAHLDDDDWWEPQKLERQLEFAERSPCRWPIISSLVTAQFDEGQAIWPRRIPEKSEALGDYLFIRNTLFQGEGLIQASTLLIPRDLLTLVPLDPAMERHEDWDWLLRAVEQPDAELIVVPEVLSTWNLQTYYSHMSSPARNSWKASLAWIQQHHHRLSQRAYASFVLAEVAARAAKARDWPAFFTLLAEASIQGSPTLKMLLLYVGMWLFPTERRGQIRQILQNLKRGDFSNLAFRVLT